MKAISLWQPWASLVGIKEIETRSWYTKHRGDLAIHASARFTDDYKKLCIKEPFKSALEKLGYRASRSVVNDKVRVELPCGNVVSISNLVECCLIRAGGLYKAPNGMPVKGPESFTEFYAPLPGEPERSFGDYTPGRYAWILEGCSIASGANTGKRAPGAVELG